MSQRHKRTEAEPKKGYSSEELYRILFEQASDGIFIADSSGNYIEVNPRGCEMLGYSRAEILGFSISDLIPPVDLQQDPLHFEELGVRKMTLTERRLRRKDGTYINVEISGKMLSDGMILGLVRDTSERKASEETLRQAEEKYRNIFEHSLDGIFQSTPAGRFITVNPALARMWGYDSPEDLIHSINNIALQVYVNPEERNEFLRVMNEGNEVNGFEFQAYRKDGSVLWVQESVRSVRDANGELLYFEGTVRDISAVKQAEEFLRRSEDRYRRTLNNMLEGCQIIDYDWRFIYVNDTAARQGRRKPEDMLMRTMMELYPEIEKTEMFAALQRCMDDRTPHRMENQFTFPDGDTGWFELSIEPVPEGLFILSIDITERKQAERELQEREVRYRTLFENLPIPVFTKDREGRYTSFNHEESRYWAKSPIGHTDNELLPSDIAEALREHDLQVMETGQPWIGEEKFQSSEGLVYAFGRKVPLYDAEGNVIGLLGASLDITERKQAEKKIGQQLGRLAALSEIDRIIASSFDLRLTLNQILRHVIQQLEVDAATVLLANPSTNTLEYVAGDGFHELSIKQIKLRVGEGYAGKVALERRTIHLPNMASAEPPFSRAYLTENEKFISYYGLPLVAKGQLKGILEVFHRKPLDPDEEWLSFLETLAEQAAIAIDNTELFNNLQQKNAELTLAYDATIEGWSYALDLRDKETEGHTKRVTDMTFKLGKKFGLQDNQLTYARWGALLHDIGKMGVPDAILQKPDKLSDEEWEIMKLHPVFARNMLERINYLKSAIDIPYCHHEKWDGTGYPRGLKGEQIPLAARIFAIADVWDALTSDRPYRPARPRKDALEYVRNAAGTHFDPQVVKLFFESEELWNDSNE